MSFFITTKTPEGTSNKPGFHIQLQGQNKETNILYSVYRIEENIIWKFAPTECNGRSYPHHFISVLGSSNSFPSSNEEFLKVLQNTFPKDLDFFLWHPEVLRGYFYEK